MIISHSLKYVFFAVPKTASKSISELLINRFQGEYHGNYHNVVIPEECLGYYKFCTVRHPYTRAVSLYHHILERPRHRCHKFVKEHSFEEWLVWLNDPDMPPILLFSEDDLKLHKVTCELELELFAQSVTMSRGRDLSQTDYLSYAYALNYLDKIDLIIRQEELAEGIKRLPFIDSDVEIPHVNASKTKADWRKLLNTKTEALIYEWSKEDFVNFGYEREVFHEDSRAVARQAV